MEDTCIINLYHARDGQAIGETATKYGKLLTKIALGVLRNWEDSEEVVNDTYTKAWDTMPPEWPDSLKAYLSRIARNLSIDRYRHDHAQKRSGVLVELSDMMADHRDLEGEFQAKELGKALELWLSKLPQKQRVLFVKRYFFLEEVSELAKQWGVSSRAMTSTLYRLRQKCKTYLEGEGYVL